MVSPFPTSNGEWGSQAPHSRALAGSRGLLLQRRKEPKGREGQEKAAAFRGLKQGPGSDGSIAPQLPEGLGQGRVGRLETNPS